VLEKGAGRNGQYIVFFPDHQANVSARLEVDFDDMEMIAGALKYTQYNFFIKWVMKGIARKEGGSTDTSRDHEYTDWEQVTAYARRLAE